jgi:tRNA modification GTPase
LGNALKKGFALVLAGRPNAGKSTLFNAFLNEDKAIVSDIAGTTRDAIEDFVHFGDLKVRLVDTAGIREATDVIEREGIHRTFRHVEASGATLYVMDAASISLEELRTDLELLSSKTKRLWLVANKADLVSGDGKLADLKRVAEEVLGGELLGAEVSGLNDSAVKVHLVEGGKVEFVFETVVAKDRESVRKLVGVLSGIFQEQLSQFQGQTVVTNARHAQALEICSEELTLILNGISQGLTGDLLSFHLRSGIAALAAITGEIDNEEVLGHIFSKFCIGK